MRLTGDRCHSYEHTGSRFARRLMGDWLTCNEPNQQALVIFRRAKRLDEVSPCRRLSTMHAMARR